MSTFGEGGGNNHGIRIVELILWFLMYFLGFVSDCIEFFMLVVTSAITWHEK